MQKDISSRNGSFRETESCSKTIQYINPSSLTFLWRHLTCSHCDKMFWRQFRKMKGVDLKNVLVFNFVCLLFNLFLVVMQLNRGLWPVETFFQPVLTDADRRIMAKTLKTFVTAMDAANLTYMLYGGTLIGKVY